MSGVLNVRLEVGDEFGHTSRGAGGRTVRGRWFWSGRRSVVALSGAAARPEAAHSSEGAGRNCSGPAARDAGGGSAGQPRGDAGKSGAGAGSGTTGGSGDGSKDGAGKGGAGGDQSDSGEPPCGPPGSRLNLLLSYAGWQPDPWVNRLPRLLQPMGVQSLCAGSGRQASEVLKNFPIHIAIVDLALPLDEACNAGEEGGARVLDLLARLKEPPPTVVIKRSRSHRDDGRDIAAALRAGAFAVVDRPRDVRDLELMLEVLRRCMGRFYMGRWPGAPRNPGPSGQNPGGRGQGGAGRGPYIPPNTV